MLLYYNIAIQFGTYQVIKTRGMQFFTVAHLCGIRTVENKEVTVQVIPRCPKGHNKPKETQKRSTIYSEMRKRLSIILIKINP